MVSPGELGRHVVLRQIGEAEACEGFEGMNRVICLELAGSGEFEAMPHMPTLARKRRV